MIGDSLVLGYWSLVLSQRSPLCPLASRVILSGRFWKGGESLRSASAGRGGKSELQRARCRVTQHRPQGRSADDTRGRSRISGIDGQCHREYTAVGLVPAVRVKRWSKSPPLEEQSTRHGKPHPEQGQIGDHGAARSSRSCASGIAGLGYWLLRQMILSLAQAGQTEFGLQPFQNLL